MSLSKVRKHAIGTIDGKDSIYFNVDKWLLLTLY